ncbi:MAG: protein translocase subunit SecF [Bdellovibrionales bacterium]|nr:protein translocase subunit SecF [Bdellovibrionales bacterium]
MAKFDSGRFDFVGKMTFFVVLSTVAVVGTLALFFLGKPNYGIDFAGGVELQLKSQQPIEVAEMRDFLRPHGLEEATIQTFKGSNEIVVRFSNLDGQTEKEVNDKTAAKVNEVTEDMKTKFAAKGLEVRGQAAVGPQIGSQLKRNSMLALFYSLLVILIYVAMRFDYEFAPGAVLALFHDAIVTFGVVMLLGREINIQILAAILTIIGYSLNDTIVIYDRIRENIPIYRGVPMRELVNKSINEMLGRSLLTSVTAFLSVICLAVIGGGVIADFATVMAIGIIIGSYSTYYIAVPVVISFQKFKPSRV